MIRLNDENTSMLDKLRIRLVLEQNSSRFKNSKGKFEDYVSEYIVGAMEQWIHSTHLEKHLTETELEKLASYDEDKCLLEDIIEFVVNNEDSEYPLVLDFCYAYDMIIDFAESIDTVKVKCLNCGKIFDVRRKDIYRDKGGYYTECIVCGGTFDVDID